MSRKGSDADYRAATGSSATGVRATTKASRVVMIIVPVTAMP